MINSYKFSILFLQKKFIIFSSILKYKQKNFNVRIIFAIFLNPFILLQRVLNWFNVLQIFVDLRILYNYYFKMEKSMVQELNGLTNSMVINRSAITTSNTEDVYDLRKYFQINLDHVLIICPIIEKKICLEKSTSLLFSRPSKFKGFLLKLRPLE